MYSGRSRTASKARSSLAKFVASIAATEGWVAFGSGVIAASDVADAAGEAEGLGSVVAVGDAAGVDVLD